MSTNCKYKEHINDRCLRINWILDDCTDCSYKPEFTCRLCGRELTSFDYDDRCISCKIAVNKMMRKLK